jgi:hypothetical protein
MPKLALSAGVAGALSLALSGPAAARTPPTVRLIYERAANAAECPDRDTVLDAVRARLGFDPFREPAEITIAASVSRAGEQLYARIRLSDGTGQTGERRLASHRADCAELASAMELALSIAIDPLSSAREPATTPPPVAEPAPPATAPVAVAVRTPAAPAGPPRQVDVQLGLVGNIGDTLAPTIGVFAGLGLRGEWWSISIEGRADLPRTQDVGGGSITAGTLAATLAPCLRGGPFGACALATLEALRGSGQDLDNARQMTSLFGAVGARALVELPAQGPVAFRAQVDVVSPLTRTALTVGGDAVWTSPPVTVAVGLATVVKFR